MLTGLWSVRGGVARRALACATFAAATLAVYRVVNTSVGPVWLASDRFGAALGGAIGALVGRPLAVGATFGGVDFLVLMAAWCAAWCMETAEPGRSRRLWGAAAILAAQGLYLVVVAFAADALAWLPPADPKVEERLWLSTLRHAIPWNLPLAGALLHAGVVAVMARRSAWRGGERAAAGAPARFAAFVRGGCVAAAAAGLALATTQPVGRLTLDGKKIVFYEKCFGNWLKPQHEDYGRLSIGMYGLLPAFVRSLGAQCVVSPDLSAADIEGADALVLIFPNEPWAGGQLDRIRAFVEGGGSLLVLGEHTVREKNGGARFNDVLKGTGMEVPFDSATYAVGGWLQSFEALAHPVTLGMADDRNQYGIVIGASVAVRWPARPVIVGRWGWSDGGDEAGPAMMGDHAYNAGEKLGDMVLVAEQRVGDGRIVVFGDTSSFSNGINMGAHEFTSRLLAYLAGPGGGPQSGGRGWLALFCGVALVGLLARRAAPAEFALALLALAVLRTAGVRAAGRAAEQAPDGARAGDCRLAYVDESHLGLFSGESWRDDGLMGLAMNLMRNGYLTLLMQDFSAARLERADLFVGVAPARAYTGDERRAIRRFIEKGGLFVTTVGYDERGPSQALLRDLGLEVGDGRRRDARSADVRPMGFFKSRYLKADDGYRYVRFHAAWPVAALEPDADVLAYGKGDLPVILARQIGRGRAVLVGDSCFALNGNLEVEGGQPFEGMRENPHFWRWLVTYLRDRRLWVPPAPANALPATNALPAASAAPAGGAAGEGRP